MNDGRRNPPKKRATCSKRQRVQPIEEETGQTLADMEDMFTENETKEIRTALLRWYDHNHRVLPWRQGRENQQHEDKAYAVWVSEVMLQQTRVQTVIDYYNRWMRKWPTLHHLAQATLEEVNEMWAGLGYYRRARFLLEGAKMIDSGVEGFPNTVVALRKIHGIGDYTAGAIASIAFNEVAPAVDGNVTRVVSRLKAISTNPKERHTILMIWNLSAQLVDTGRPGDFNESLMELGATLCTPSNPSCSSCPISANCRAFSISQQDNSKPVTDYPARSSKARPRDEFSAVCVVEVSGKHHVMDGRELGSRFLLVKRPNQGLLAGLWEFPCVALGRDCSPATRRREVDGFLEKTFRIDPTKTRCVILREHIGQFFHVFSHIHMKLYVEVLVIHNEGELCEMLDEQQMEENVEWKFVDSNELASLGLTSGVRKVYNMVQKFKQNGLPPTLTLGKKKKS